MSEVQGTVLHCRPPGAPASEVRIGHGLRRSLGAWAVGRRTFALADRAVVASDPDLLPPPWPRLLAPGGEAAKTLAFAETVLRAMVQAGLDREGRLAAIGGGSIGDVGGLCAALHLRGIGLWTVPTTLLAMVDSAVGGKNGVNLPEGKNLVGTVHPPELVVVDLDFLATLPEESFHSGLGEVVKTAIGLDGELFGLLETAREAVLGRDGGVLAEVVARCVAAKIRVVETDLREAGPRRLLNLGHTLGHALEAHGGFREPHGRCVARGLHFALRLAVAEKALAAADAARAHDLLQAFGFPETPLPPAAELLPLLGRDKKVTGGTVHFALPTGIGRSEVRPLPLDRVASALEAG